MLERTILLQEIKVLKRENLSLKKQVEKCCKPREKVDLSIYFNQGKSWIEAEEKKVWLFFNKYSTTANGCWVEIVRTKEELIPFSLKMGRTAISIRVRNSNLRRVCRNFTFYNTLFFSDSIVKKAK